MAIILLHCQWSNPHYSDIIMSVMASRIISLTIVYSTIYSGADQRKHQSSTSLAFVRGIHRWPVNSPHKWPVMQKMFSFDDFIMWWIYFNHSYRLISSDDTATTIQSTTKPCEYFKVVLKIRTMCHGRDLRKLTWSCKQLHLLCPPDPWNLPGTALLSGCQNSQGALKPTE